MRLKLPLMLRLGILFLSPAGISLGQQPAPFVVEPPPNSAYPDYGPGNSAAARLRRQPAKMFTFDRAALRDVLRYLADDAGIPFVGIPESDVANKHLVTFTMEASPFTALESVCRDNGIKLSYENGIWYMRTADEEREQRIKEEEEYRLIGIAYSLRYDPVDRVDFAGSSRASSSEGSVNSVGAGGLAVPNGNLPLQKTQRVFASVEPRIVNEIRSLLGMKPITYQDGKPQADPELEAGTAAKSTGESTRAFASTQEKAAKDSSNERLAKVYVPPQKTQVIYNSDTNTLWVVATRAQHKWVADYLLAVDRPQALIAIEVKFFETTRNPSKELGINWAGTMQGGYNVTLSNIKATPAGSIDYMTGTSHGVSTGTGNATSITSGGGAGGDAGKIMGGVANVVAQAPLDGISSVRGATLTAGAPYSAILTAHDVSLAIQAFMSDDKTSMVQYPRVLTVNNREVAITSAVNTPVNAGVTVVTAGTSGGQNVGTLAYLPTGTQINILPKALEKDQIAMTVAITISNILPGGGKILNLGTGPSSYPETSQRVYNASLQVYSGYTLAVGGLEATNDDRSNNGIPFLQDIPGVGELFKSKTRTRNKKNLIVFITPTIIENPKATRGISETPESVIPLRPNDPTPPAFTPDGQLVGGYDAINAAFAWLDFQAKWFKQLNKENRTDKESVKQLRAVIASARMLVRDIASMQETADATRAEQLARLEERAVATLTELNRVLSVAQTNVM